MICLSKNSVNNRHIGSNSLDIIFFDRPHRTNASAGKILINGFQNLSANINKTQITIFTINKWITVLTVAVTQVTVTQYAYKDSFRKGIISCWISREGTAPLLLTVPCFKDSLGWDGNAASIAKAVGWGSGTDPRLLFYMVPHSYELLFLPYPTNPPFIIFAHAYSFPFCPKSIIQLCPRPMAWHDRAAADWSSALIFKVVQPAYQWQSMWIYRYAAFWCELPKSLVAKVFINEKFLVSVRSENISLASLAM